MFNLKKLLMICGVAVLTTGCGVTNKFGVHSADYANAKESPPLIMPSGSLMASNRYEIPAVPASNTSKVITDVAPPDYCAK